MIISIPEYTCTYPVNIGILMHKPTYTPDKPTVYSKWVMVVKYACMPPTARYLTHSTQQFEHVLISAWHSSLLLFVQLRGEIGEGIDSWNESNVQSTLSNEETLCDEFEGGKSSAPSRGQSLLRWCGQESLVTLTETRLRT